MMTDDVKIPDLLFARLDIVESASLLAFLRAISVILADNKLPFFPNYTDHGVRHVSRLLETIATQLIPSDVLPTLTSADVTVLVCASLLHDLGMHIRENSFLQLIEGQLPHQPIHWFDQSETERKPDLPWSEEWINYRSNVQRFSDHDFFLVLGDLPTGPDLKHWIDQKLPTDARQWSSTDYLLIGEFIRRHHGRLAHEIAMFGFPGLTPSEFPVLENIMPKLADIAGVVARSHSLPLREAAAYLAYKHSREIRPRGVAAIYHMALLRIGDYLQIDSERAPSILFKLRSPDVPTSVDAWNQHGAVAHISYALDDPVAVKIELGSAHSLRTHLQLQTLIEGLQKELDTCSAVLSECYARVLDAGMNRIRLAKYRVYSNYNERSLLDRLPFIPEAINLGADPRIVSLMVGPIYGPFPHFGIRELLQNAVDAIWERRQYWTNRGLSDKEIDRTKPDVTAELIQELDGLVVSITDNGIGMTAETVRDYFLRAGASFRDSRRWRQEFVDAAGRSKVRRSGRFGVGVFAGFLLGGTMEVVTRWVGASFGLRFSASIGSDLIELSKADVPVGTTVTIRVSPDIAETFADQVWPQCADWFGLGDPSVEFRRKGASPNEVTEQKVVITEVQMQGSVPGWGAFAMDEFARVSWTCQRLIAPTLSDNEARLMEHEGSPYYEESRYNEGELTYSEDRLHVHSFTEYNWEQQEIRRAQERRQTSYGSERPSEFTEPTPKERVYCNGFLIGTPVMPEVNRKGPDDFDRRGLNREETRKRALPLRPARFAWDESGPLARPSLVITDNEGAFPLTLRRDAILEHLPFERDLERDIITDMVGWFLACAPTAPLWFEDQTISYFRKYPLARGKHPLGSTFSWICSEEGVGLLHRELLRRLGTKALLLAGRTRSSQSVVRIEGVWNSGDRVALDKDVLAIPLPQQIFGIPRGREKRDAREDVTIFLMEYIRYLESSREFAMNGGLIVRSGFQGYEEIRIDNCSEAATDLVAAIGTVTKATTYYDSGSGRHEMTRESRFAGEIKIKVAEGDDPMSDIWNYYVGDGLLPFDEGKRAAAVSNACRDTRIKASFEKWSNWRSSREMRLLPLGIVAMIDT